MALTAQELKTVDNWYRGIVAQGAGVVTKSINMLTASGTKRTPMQSEVLRRLKAWRAPAPVGRPTPLVQAAVKKSPARAARDVKTAVDKAVVRRQAAKRAHWRKMAAIKAGLEQLLARAKRDNAYLQQQKAIWVKRTDADGRKLYNALLAIEAQKPPAVVMEEPVSDVVQPTAEPAQARPELTPTETTDPADEDFLFDDIISEFDPDIWTPVSMEPYQKIDNTSVVTKPTPVDILSQPTDVIPSFQVPADTLAPDAPPPKKKGGGLLAAAFAIGTAIFLGG